MVYFSVFLSLLEEKESKPSNMISQAEQLAIIMAIIIKIIIFDCQTQYVYIAMCDINVCDQTRSMEL